MGRRKKKSPKYSFLTILVALLVIIGSRFTGNDSDHQKKYDDSSSKTKYETSVDKNDRSSDDNDKSSDKNEQSSAEKEENRDKKDGNYNNKDTQSETVNQTAEISSNEADFDYSKDVPAFSNKPSVQVNNNTPYFSKPKSKKVYKNYSNLDSMNRVGPCEVLTGPEYLPKEKRGDISHVKPTGWKQKKYDFVDGKHLYNRCHLIGFQIAGDNDDWRNLMTGTRYMNVDGMLPYENEITHYIKSTKHHVKYRVTPVFIGNDKVARGVLMQAYSVEDNRIKFNVFCYNVQPRVAIDYSTGYSKLAN